MRADPRPSVDPRRLDPPTDMALSGNANFSFVGGYSNALSLEIFDPTGRDVRRLAASPTAAISPSRRAATPCLGIRGWLGRPGLGGRNFNRLQVALVPTWFWPPCGDRDPGATDPSSLGQISLVVDSRRLARRPRRCPVDIGASLVGFLNYVFVWATVHQLDMPG
jgi:hypothetical protein